MIDLAKLKKRVEKFYKNSEATYRDARNALCHYQNLAPQQENYTFTNGSVKELINLAGTIPVNYKGNTYNIPICIWLLDTHPNNAPICYVKPTSHMLVKASKFVDQNGRIYLPYLEDWKPYKSDLLELIQVLIVTFGETPPVYSKPKSDSYSFPSSTHVPTSSGVALYPTKTTNYPPAEALPKHPIFPPNSPAIYPNYPQYPGPSIPSYPPTGNFGLTIPSAGTGTIKDEHIKVSLISGIEEKLLRKMKEQVQQKQAELQTLTRTQEELKHGKMKLDLMINKLEKEQSDLDKSITVLKDTEQELKTAIGKMENQEAINVDDAVTTTAPLYKQ
ncbi:tumor susceptibility gene 101 protein-like [Rhynchophorus ferrugineus]|uniref:tumor susceptibility gene 101 protein-like n=1 Tax=Rhynchophorus ferrugineus TaxID=354439 RepID=UPI003FCD1821